MYWNLSYSPETPNLRQIRQFLEQCDLEIWRMTLKNNRAPLLCYFKLCAAFRSYWWPFAWTLLWSLVITPENFMMIRWWEHSQKGVTDRQTDGQTDRQTDGQTENTICRAAWSQLITIGHLFCATSNFVQYFVPIGEFKLELQSGNSQFGSKSTIFKAVRPWNLTDDLGKQ